EPSTTTTHSPLLKIVNHTGFIITVSVVLVLTALAAVAWYFYTRFYAVDSDEQKNQTTPTTEPKTPLASDAASTTSSNAPSSGLQSSGVASSGKPSSTPSKGSTPPPSSGHKPTSGLRPGSKHGAPAKSANKPPATPK